ncbi:DUF228 domain-containing protein (plasmid) [Borrelia coriaceae]|uniref:Uncharacterized protein n=1 Tax=Borrelia coriaceae ATCC 43381 TaxID=1408429 RepID=W5T2H9_9SPIR|nr:DUF228 domain-containing protein [Borrelia coriaceae]AHH11531.1 Hypothetical protein BCO_0122501 [Borrelia coriaceae ATCC 43381]UPA16919.1 DUF228 domain-containing protein [Borrelia coriaceae]
MPQENIAKLKEEYDKKVKEIQDLMKNPNRDAGLFHVDIGFKDKNLHFSNQGGTLTSSVDKLENYPVKGYPYKRGVKLSFEDGSEPCVEAGGCDDLYGICIDIDEFTKTATVIPITNNFQGYVISRSSDGISIGDKLDFDSDGKVIKSSYDSQVPIKAIALSNVFTLNLTDDISKKDQEDYKLYLIKIAIYGSKCDL